MKTEEFEVIISSETPVLIDFYSTSCDPCKWLLPILTDVEKHFGSKLIIHKINVEQSTMLAHKYEIRSVPTLILFKNKKMLWRIAGFDIAPVMIAAIEEKLDQ